MSRTIAALYDTRAEAEFARARLVSRLKARSPRIIAKDTIGALDALDIASAEKESYRDKLGAGGHLLVAEAPNGANAEGIIEVLEEAIGRADRRAGLQWGDAEKGVRVELPDDERIEHPQQADPNVLEDGGQTERPGLSSPALEGRAKGVRDEASDIQRAEESEGPWYEQKLRKGKSKGESPAGAARVRSFTHEAPAEEQVTLIDETLTVENRPSGRSLSDSEMDAGDLFKERVFEVAAMREEPVVTKVAVVREEVIVRKILSERTETIRDTVRQTQVEVEDLPAPEETEPVFFGRAPTKPPQRR